ncbi:uncharacterized protein [Nothobranchius furzeri]|uniref:uncharacterized protein n=1 Tax=Nothobranchius furzeri TaxID=105023 RepID=UPI003904D2F7
MPRGSCSSSSRNRPPLRRNRGMGTGRALGCAPRLPPPRAPPLSLPSSSSSSSADEEGEEQREQGQGQRRRSRASASAPSRASPTASSEEKSEEPHAQPPEHQAQPPEPQRSPQQPEVDTRGTKQNLTFSPASEELTETEAPVPKKKSEKSKRTKEAISSPSARAFSDTEKSPKKKLSAMETAFQGLAPCLAGKSKASKLRNSPLGTSIESYLEDYFTFIFCPKGKSKMQENAVSKLSRAKVFVKYLLLGSDSPASWNWQFLYNIPLLKSYPAVLCKFGLSPTTISLYLGQAVSFVEYFRAMLPSHSRLHRGQTKILVLKLKKLSRDIGRTVLGHQLLTKQKKVSKLVSKEDLRLCQLLAREKIPSLLEDIEKAPARDPKTRYRFFGYLAAYLSVIYGHRTGVLTRMRVKEVRQAIGDDQTGYLINVLEHKTARKFGTAQIYLEPEEFLWFQTWLRLRDRAVARNGYLFSSLGRGEAKDMARYFSKAWKEMGL